MDVRNGVWAASPVPFLFFFRVSSPGMSVFFERVSFLGKRFFLIVRGGLSFFSSFPLSKRLFRLGVEAPFWRRSGVEVPSGFFSNGLFLPGTFWMW